MSGLAGIIGLGIVVVPLMHPPVDSELRRTPTLALEIWQDNKLVNMVNKTKGHGDYVSRVTAMMQSKPFEIHMPKLTDEVGISINAWKDDSLFNLKADTDPAAPPYDSVFGPGRSHVDDVHASARLFLSKDTYSSFSPARSDLVDGNKSSVYFSQVDDPPPPIPGLTAPSHPDPFAFPADVYTPDSKSLHKLTDWHQNLYLLVWQDDNHNGIINSDEYEYLTLQFPGKAKS